MSIKFGTHIPPPFPPQLKLLRFLLNGCKKPEKSRLAREIINFSSELRAISMDVDIRNTEGGGFFFYPQPPPLLYVRAIFYKWHSPVQWCCLACENKQFRFNLLQLSLVFLKRILSFYPVSCQMQQGSELAISPFQNYKQINVLDTNYLELIQIVCI